MRQVLFGNNGKAWSVLTGNGRPTVLAALPLAVLCRRQLRLRNDVVTEIDDPRRAGDLIKLNVIGALDAVAQTGVHQVAAGWSVEDAFLPAALSGCEGELAGFDRGYLESGLGTAVGCAPPASKLPPC